MWVRIPRGALFLLVCFWWLSDGQELAAQARFRALLGGRLREIIEALFRDQQDNPERYKDPGILTARYLIDAGIVDKTYTAAKFNESAQILQTHNDNDQRTLQEIFGFPVTGKQVFQARYLSSFGKVGGCESITISDGADNS
ncbi:hypothetical protein [Bifidobacterium asteroides]|uniref:hypothetical protein n=1 Tax=Bifidobacterium asteroides TaxID=1684 RepID=UPI003A7F7F8D